MTLQSGYCICGPKWPDESLKESLVFWKQRMAREIERDKEKQSVLPCYSFFVAIFTVLL